MKPENKLTPREQEEQRGDDFDATYTEAPNGGGFPIETQTGPDDIIRTDDEDEPDTDETETQQTL